LLAEEEAEAFPEEAEARPAESVRLQRIKTTIFLKTFKPFLT
jgi:hypothetical protein